MKCFYRGAVFYSVIIAGLCSCTQVIKMKDEADAATRASDSILTEFKRVDESLQKSNATLDSANKIFVDSVSRKANY